MSDQEQQDNSQNQEINQQADKSDLQQHTDNQQNDINQNDQIEEMPDHENNTEGNQEITEQQDGLQNNNEEEYEETIPEEEYEKLVEEAKQNNPEQEVQISRTRTVTRSKKSEIIKDTHQSEQSEKFDILSDLQKFVKEKLQEDLDMYDPEIQEWNDYCSDMVNQFGSDPTILSMFIWCEQKCLRFQYKEPPELSQNAYDTSFMYFIKIPNERTNSYNFFDEGHERQIATGVIKKDLYLKGLLKQMNINFIPYFIKDKQMPDNVKKEFLSQLHKFMAVLTEIANQKDGLTELYIPKEDLSDIATVAQDKDLLQRLETVLIHWYRQIKDVINNQDSQHDNENAGPQDEIDYWLNRKINLSHIDQQLEKEELKNIQKILKDQDSSYVEAFQQSKEKIKSGSSEADDNLIFLSSLKEPCQKLREATPKEIPLLLPDILNRVRMIWEKSQYYNTNERIQGLLHKISNEIIQRCKKQINIKEMLEGDVEKCMQDLEESIECGRKWKEIYDKTKLLVSKKNKQKKWEFNQNSIFAQVDAFVQRCIELREIGEGQLQFARKGNDISIPQFGGTKGPEIVNILEEIKNVFRKSIDQIKGSEQDKILDVKASKWHEQFNNFKNQMKELDVMYQKIINSAFETISTVQLGVEMLEAFDYLAKRESIKAAVKKKAVTILELFSQELDQTKLEFDNMKKVMYIPINHGKNSGSAIWVRNLIHRIEKMKEHIDRLTFVDDSIKKSALEKYDNYYLQFKQYILNQKLRDWKEENKELEESAIGVRLDKHILIKITQNEVNQNQKNPILKSIPDHLESNFDEKIFKLIRETTAWKKLTSFGIVIPSYADDFVSSHKENLRTLREYVMLVVRDYNQIIDSMSDKIISEKKLFRQHLEVTEKVINPGLNKLKWSSKGVIENFVRNSRKQCEDLQQKLQMFKTNTSKILEKCREISQKELIKIDKKKQYGLTQFEEEQEKYRKDVQQKLRSSLEEIRRILSETYDSFYHQKPQVQDEWFEYLGRIDDEIEQALKKSLKTSLLSLQKVIGDQDDDSQREKIQPVQIFKLSIELDSNFNLGFKPSPDYLISMVRTNCAALTEIIRDFSRMEVQLFDERKRRLEELFQQQEQENQNQLGKIFKKDNKLEQQQIMEYDQKREALIKQKESFYEKISDDHDVKKLTEKILSNLQKNCEKIQNLLNPWERNTQFFKSSNKEKYFEQKVNKENQVSSYIDQLDQCENYQQSIQQEKNSEKLGCIVVDNTNVKQNLIGQMIEWQNSFLNHILDKAYFDLKHIHRIFQSSEQELRNSPQNLYELQKQNEFLKNLFEQKPNLEGSLTPLEEKFRLLDTENKQNISEEVQLQRNTLRQAWENFCIMLDNVEKRNNQVKQIYYHETIKQLEDFANQTREVKQTFSIQAPYTSSNYTNDKAFNILLEQKELTQQLRKTENEMKFGVNLFTISYVQNADLDYVELEIDHLQSIWQLKQNWDNKWSDLKLNHFKDLVTDELEEMAEDDIYEIIQNANKYNMKNQEVVKKLIETITTFKDTQQYIKILREPYMRDRHWEKIRKYLGPSVQPDHESFNLGEIMNLNLIQHSEAVRQDCEIAREEYKIESALDNIQKRWDVLELEMEPHKKAYKIKRTDEVFAALEDDMATLSAQKTTLFYDSFKTIIEQWELTLQNILETLETLQHVQRQWIYLESIFQSQQNDQDKQLIGDISKFQQVNQRLCYHMTRLNKEKNVKASLYVEGFLQELQDISKKLDESQKILFQLLERKRKEFPRFYFLSNDDLFEILGNSKDPLRINKHIKKCFEGIKKLDIVGYNQAIAQRGPKQNDSFEVKAMIAPDGEIVKFNQAVQCELGVESWLKIVEQRMRDTLRKELQKTKDAMKKSPQQIGKWIKDWIQQNYGQMLVTSCQISWTESCQKVLTEMYNDDTKKDKVRAWKSTRDEKKIFLDKLTEMVRTKSDDIILKLKLNALITIEVHQRDIMEQLYKTCNSPQSFEWLKQLRFYHSPQPQGDQVDCYIEQINNNTKFPYGFEYQGNNGRLVITALTDRCYLTLTSAMILRKGGQPQGPAGTGKTETVKDLGKALAKFVFVFNCSEGLDAKSIGRMFSGLVQTGGWGCFDEFNRIEVEVLSVVAQQIHSIFEALKLYHPEKFTAFAFDGEVISINEQIAIFITMNPGYAGRSELPDNLKSLFRPISMMVPDLQLICENTLYSEGFKFGRILSQKMVTLYNLMQKQLSQQDHYDFGMRAIKSVLLCAGGMRRSKGVDSVKEQKDKDQEQEEQTQETILLMSAIMDMNMPKFVAEDIPLFQALFNDLFPGIDLQENQNLVLQEAIEEELKKAGLQIHDVIIQKIIQLYETKQTRHGNMLVGQTQSGKSTCWKILAKAMNTLNETKPQKYSAVKYEILNPKAVTMNELYGYVDQVSMEWNDGVLSSMMSRLCKQESLDQRWMILDGPIDTLWIESMNTVLDDNKVLTLLNGDRINLPNQVGLIFEVEDLSVASPATVSRAGMIYIDINDIGWEPYASSFIDAIKDEQLRDEIYQLFEKWIPKLLKQKRSLMKELVPVSDSAAIVHFCKFLDALQKNEPFLSFDNPKKDEKYYLLLEKWFVFAIVWSIGATVNEEGRVLFDYSIRDIESMFPHQNTVYDYFINNEKNEWQAWEEKLSANWKPSQPNLPFHQMFVPTVDTVRNRDIIFRLLKHKIQLLVVGITGTGKSALLNMILQELDDSYAASTLVFSARTDAAKAQDLIESKLIKRTKNKMVPDGKKAVFFIDDFNMPRKDAFGTQSSLELIRQWIDYDGWYDRSQRDLFKWIMDIQFMAAMGAPGGGRAQISKRIQSKFAMINFTFPTEKQILRIFQSILVFKLSEFDEEIKPLSEPISIATINLFKQVQDYFLPTPAKSHYLFNMRDMSKVIQGLYQINKFYQDTKQIIYRIWVHECMRVFHDRLISFEDRQQFKKLVQDQIEQVFQSNMKECTNENEEDTIFVDFGDPNVQGQGVYQEVPYNERGALKHIVEEKLQHMNEKSRSQAMDIVLFQDAISYICKIHRIIKLGKGHGMLVGDGGSGRHSLTKLATFIAGYTSYQIEISKNYRLKEFREDIKKWSEMAGLKNKSGVFIFSDNDIVNEAFIEDINNILSVGEIPNLFTKDDLQAMRDKLRKDIMRERNLNKDVRIPDEELFSFFFSRMQQNFHVIICMSKSGDTLRNYIRQYPGLINNTTMIWFMSWPEEALVEVAQKYLKDLTIEEGFKHSISTFFGQAHQSIIKLSDKMSHQLKRHYYVTPSNYIELVIGYNELLTEKQNELGKEIAQLKLGLQKLDEAAENSESLDQKLKENQVELSNKKKECDDLYIKIENDTLQAKEKEKELEKGTAELEKEKLRIEQMANEAENDLAKAEPILLEAEKGLENLKKDKIAELKTYSKPPPEVNTVLAVVMTLLGKDPSWASVKKEIASPDFLKQLQNFKKEEITQNTIKKIEKYTHKSEMLPSKVMGVSEAAGCIWEWVLAIEQYAKAWKDIEPKRKKVQKYREQLTKKMDELQNAQESFQQTQQTIKEKLEQLESTKFEKQKLEETYNLLQIKQDRAQKLIEGLASTKEGWRMRKEENEQKYKFLVGDALITAALLSYSGPFPSEYRDEFLNLTLIMGAKKLKIPYSTIYKFNKFLAKDADFLKWNFQGLPDDEFSKDNGVLVLKGRRYPLLVDPQMQGNSWIKRHEADRYKEKVQVFDPQTDNYMQKIELAISQGYIVIFQNVDEELDPAIEPVLNKQIKKLAGKQMIYLGEKEILYNPNFRFYMTTKLANPKYKPEITSKVTLVNFAVKEQGLEEQLVSVVIQKMEDQLEKNRKNLIKKKDLNETTLKNLDQDILRMLQETKTSLVDDENLIKKLQESKETEEEIKHQIENSSTAMRKILNARENYRPLAKLASKLFFIINDFQKLDNMYQFALDQYIQLFTTNITKHQEKNPSLADSLQEKLDSIGEKHKFEVFRYCCRGLFEKDKLLLALQIAINLSNKENAQKDPSKDNKQPDKSNTNQPQKETNSKEVSKEEYNFFLRGGQVHDRKGQPLNPNPEWITQTAWDMICELEKIVKFNGIVGAFVHNNKEWKRWYMSSQPEIDQLPGEWEEKCDKLEKMILLKAVRPDRVLQAAKGYIAERIGEQYIQPQQLSYEKLFEDSRNTQPIIFILAPGVDPFIQLDQLAKSKDKTLTPVSLGQGQAKKARDKVYEASKQGLWIFLANCHLSLSFLKELEKIIDSFDNQNSDVQPQFRLFLSTNPHPKFPISILQKSMRVTTEPPKGVKQNMTQLYANMEEEKFSNLKLQPAEKSKYKKLLFSLAWFHSVVIERKKFKSLGWNVTYDFNDSDFQTADNILQMCLEQTIEKGGEQGKLIQWDAIKYLISEVTYGGRVTDDWDRRLLNVYASELFQEKIVTEDNFKLGDPTLNYSVPLEIISKDQTAKSLDKQGQITPFFYESKIKDFPADERPEAFGQHINAEISSQIQETKNLIDSIISLEPRTVTNSGESREQSVSKAIKELLDMLPNSFDLGEVTDKIKPQDQDPLKIVLLHEMDRYNDLLFKVNSSLNNLQKGISGLVVISEELEKIMDCIFENRVPEEWSFCYHSLKPLMSWFQDLIKRCEQLYNWAYKGKPSIFWISGFSLPTGFTTALLQVSARKSNISIDSYGWEFNVLNTDPSSITQSPKDGAYISGLYLEGGRWDYDKGYLIDAEPMKLHYKMPIIHFKPVFTEGKQKQRKGQALYSCPTFMYPVRTGSREKPSYMFTVQLPCKPNTQGVVNTDFFIKRGTALLMSLDN